MSSKINDIELQQDDSMRIKLNKSILPPITPPTKYERVNRRSFIDIDDTAKTDSYLENPQGSSVTDNALVLPEIEPRINDSGTFNHIRELEQT